MARKTTQLKYPLPFRCWFRTESGGWASRAWTREDLDDAYRAGGWLPNPVSGNYSIADQRKDRKSPTKSGIPTEETSAIAEMLLALPAAQREAFITKLRATPGGYDA